MVLGASGFWACSARHLSGYGTTGLVRGRWGRVLAVAANWGVSAGVLRPGGEEDLGCECRDLVELVELVECVGGQLKPLSNTASAGLTCPASPG